MGIPVLHGVAGESAEIVQREGVGEVFESENVRELVDGLLRLRGDPVRYAELRENCLRAAPRYDRKVLAGRMLGLIERLAEPLGGRRI